METKICFKRTPQFYPNIQLDGVGLERVSSAKVLGVTISNNLKWTDHVEITNTKAATCLYPLRQLKRAGLICDDLVKFYCCVVRSVLEYAFKLFIAVSPIIYQKKSNQVVPCILLYNPRL